MILKKCKKPPNKQIQIDVSTTLLDFVKGVTFIIVAAMACSAFPPLSLQVQSGGMAAVPHDR